MNEKDQKNLTDLIEGLRKGELRAQQIFWNSYLPQLCALGTRILCDPLRAQEIAVEVLGDFLLNHVKQLKIPQAAPSYLRLMTLRKARRVRAKLHKQCALNPEISEDPGIAEQMTHEALCEFLSPRLERCLQKLSPKARHLVQLSFQSELSHKAIGDLVGASGQYVGRMIGRSLELLKRCLQLEATIRRAENKMEGSAMNAEAVLNQLLKHHYQKTLVPSCEELELVSVVSEGLATTEQALLAQRHLQNCVDCLEDFQQLLRWKAEQVSPRIGLTSAKNSTRRVWIGSLAASLLLVISASIVFYLSPSSREQQAKLIAKGEEEELAIAVQRGIQRFHLRPQDRLMPGDQIGFFYTAQTHGYLLVLDIQQNGTVSVLFPLGQTRSQPIKAGTLVALADGGVVEPSLGCGWIAAIFSDAPIILDRIEPHVQPPDQVHPKCNLSLELPEARTVWVQQIHD